MASSEKDLLTVLVALFLVGTYRSIFRSSASHRLKHTNPTKRRNTRNKTVKSTTIAASNSGGAKYVNEDSVDELEKKDGTKVGEDETRVLLKRDFEDGGSDDGTSVEGAEEGLDDGLGEYTIVCTVYVTINKTT